MLRGLYDWTMRWSASRHAVWALAAIAFVEASVFPVPPDVLLIPLVLAARAAAWRLAAVCTLASVAGGYGGYAIGALLFETVGRPIVEFYGAGAAFAGFARRYNEWGAWIVAFFAATPFPYKAVAIASGATALDPLVFGVASLLARGARFFLVAALLWYFGPAIRAFVERHLGAVAIAFCALLAGGFVLIGLVF